MSEWSVILWQQYMEFISLKVDLQLFTLFNTKKIVIIVDETWVNDQIMRSAYD